MEHNTQNLKAALQVLINTSMTVDKALADNKITPLEWAQIAIKSIAFWRVIRNADVIKQEYLLLKPADIEEVTAWVSKEFTLRNPNLEANIETLFNTLFAVVISLNNLKENKIT